jgi:hypothetical protein
MGAGLRDIAPREVYSVKVAAGAADTDFDVVAAVSGKKIVVIGFFVTCGAAETITFESDNDSTQTALTGAMTVNTNGWIKGNYNPDGHFWTIAGEKLIIARGGSVAVQGWLNYYLE